jgi:hypothetical protein
MITVEIGKKNRLKDKTPRPVRKARKYSRCFRTSQRIGIYFQQNFNPVVVVRVWVAA